MKLARPKNSRRSEITFAARTRRSVFNLPSGAFLGEDGTSGGRSTGDRDRRDRTDQPASGPAFPLQNPARWHGAEARRRSGQAGEFDQCRVWASADRIEQGDRVLFDAMPGSEAVDHLPEFFDGKAWSLDSPHMEGRVWIQASEHLVNPTVARRGDEISRLVGGGFSGSLHEQPDGENDGPDGERDPAGMRIRRSSRWTATQQMVAATMVRNTASGQGFSSTKLVKKPERAESGMALFQNSANRPAVKRRDGSRRFHVMEPIPSRRWYGTDDPERF